MNPAGITIAVLRYSFFIENYIFSWQKIFFSTLYAGIAQLIEHQPSKLRVAGLSPVSRSKEDQIVIERTYLIFLITIGLGKYQSGQMGQTVNLLSFDFGGSNPSLPTKKRETASMILFLFFLLLTMPIVYYFPMQ